MAAKTTTVHHPTLPGVSKRVATTAARRWRSAGWVSTPPTSAPADEPATDNTDKKED